jgi:hypothetical protein
MRCEIDDLTAACDPGLVQGIAIRLFLLLENPRPKSSEIAGPNRGNSALLLKTNHLKAQLSLTSGQS